MALLTIFLPLFSSIFIGFFGRFIGSQSVGILSTLNVFFSFVLSVIFFFDVGIFGNIFIFNSFAWVNSELFAVNWGLYFDSLTVTMLVVVTSISCFVHLYSLEYMLNDPHFNRFMSYLSLFTFFMLVLVTANNLLQMFIGWEGVGLCSYLLINFWHTRIQANKAAIKAMIMNRIGDFFLALAIFLCLYLFNTADYVSVFTLVPLFLGLKINFFIFDIPVIELLAFLMFFGAMGKSAQLGLHTWLPDAMEGPTPVSALIHAATMVTAGVFLIIRCSPIFEHATLSLAFITSIGGITAFFAATTGLLQNDLKKVIAYSTCSQLGYMIFACGISSYTVAIFHLFNHAFFKALLFLGAGSIIHGVSDEQDMRKMGGLKKTMPFTYSVMLIGSLALMGFPFLTGFYSKDAILESAFAQYTLLSQFAFWLGSFAAFFTAFYSMRLIYLAFLAEPNGKKIVLLNAHEPSWKMLLPLGLLAIPSIFIGYLFKDLFIGLGTDFWQASIFTNIKTFNIPQAEFLPVSIKLTPLLFSFFGLFLAYCLYLFAARFLLNLKKGQLGLIFYTFLTKKWYFDRLYNEFVSQNVIKLSFNFTYRLIDRGIIELVGPFGIGKSLYYWSNIFTKIQTGILYHYTFIFLISILFLILIFLFSMKFILLPFFILIIIAYFIF